LHGTEQFAADSLAILNGMLPPIQPRAADRRARLPDSAGY
jgi:hypothetical protein